MKYARILAKLLYVLGLVVLVGVFGSSKAAAVGPAYPIPVATNTFPNPAAVGGGPYPFFTTIGAGAFDVPVSIAVISADQPGFYDLYMEDMGWCNANYDLPVGAFPKTTPYFSTKSQVFAYNSNFTVPLSFPLVTGFAAECGASRNKTNGFWFNASDWVPDANDPAGGKYKAIFMAWTGDINPAYASAPGAAENAFRVRVTRNLGGGNPKIYFAAGAPGVSSSTFFNMSNLNRPSGTTMDYYLDFSIPCSGPNTSYGTLQFYDVDNGLYQNLSGSPNPALTYRLFEFPKGTQPPATTFIFGALTGGNHEWSQLLSYNFNKAYDYRLIISGLTRVNAITFIVGLNLPDFTGSDECNGATCTVTTDKATYRPGEAVVGTVTATNTGTKVWRTSTNHRLGDWYTADGNPAEPANPPNPGWGHDKAFWGASRVAMPVATVGLGASVTFTINTVAPAAQDTYEFAWQMVQDGVEWFGTGCRTTLNVVPINLAACNLITTNKAVYTAGETISATVRFLNNGDKNWTAIGQYKMGDLYLADGVPLDPANAPNPGSAHDKAFWGFTRRLLPANGYGNLTVEMVRPGQIASFSFNVTAPSTEGSYDFSWQMVQDGVEWFGGGCNLTIVVKQPWEYTLDESSTAAGPWGDPIRPGGTALSPAQLDISTGAVNLSFLMHAHALTPLFARTGLNYALVPYLSGGVGWVTPAGTSTAVAPAGAAPWANRPGLAPNANADYYARYSVPANTPDGTQFCVYSGITPHSYIDAGQLLSNTLCYVVVNPRYIYLTTNQGDVHAGGGSAVCNLPGATPNGVTGVNVAGKGSLGQFLVSAGGAVTDFGSGGAVGGTSQTLSSYGTICRPDLVARASQYRSDFGSTDPGATFSPSGYATSTLASRLLYHTGPVTLNAGTITGRYTLFVQGDLTIAGNLNYDVTPRALSDLPSFGVIVTGNIYIAPGVTSLVGALFANGTIDTCSPYNAAACRTNALALNGSLYAKVFNFKRTAGGIQYGADSGAAETITGSSRLFIAPPPGFKDMAPIQSQSQSPNEKPPLY